MAQFDIIGRLQIQRPSAASLKPVADSIRRSLGDIQVKVDINLAKGQPRSINALNKRLELLNHNLIQVRTNASAAAISIAQIGTGLQGASVNLKLFNSGLGGALTNLNATKKAASDAGETIEQFGKRTNLTFRRFAAFSIAAGSILSVASSAREAFKEALAFQDQIVKLSQVTQTSTGALTGLSNTISDLSTGLGASSKNLVDVSRILIQAGLSANDTRVALEALAKTELAPTFTNIGKTAEGLIAIMSQFKIKATEFESALGSINAVSATFAVESDDIIEAVRRAGGAFKAASGDLGSPINQLNELIALFTAVRSTTRESAETISTGFRTIFTRLQKTGTIQFLESFGVKLTEVGKIGERVFVGPFEAVRRLNAALAELDPRDIRFSRIVEEIGGFRQVSRVIPLIKEFGKAQSALAVAQAGQASLTRDAARAQESFAVKISRVKEEFLDLFRVISNNRAIQAVLNITLSLATAIIQLTKALEPAIPLLTILGGISLGRAALRFVPSFLGRNQGGEIPRFQRGGVVPGSGSRDTVPALLQPGEFVIRKRSVEKLGTGRLTQANQTGDIQQFQRGGKVKSGKGSNISGGISGEKLDNLVRRKAQLGSLLALQLATKNPELLSNIPESSTFLGAGVQAFALKTPSNNAIRIGLGQGRKRPKDAAVLQPTLSKQFGTLSFEVLPLAQNIGKLSEKTLSAFEDRLRQRNIDPVDVHGGNIGTIRRPEVSGGRPVTRVVAIDPGTFKTNSATLSMRQLREKNIFNARNPESIDDILQILDLNHGGTVKLQKGGFLGSLFVKNGGNSFTEEEFQQEVVANDNGFLTKLIQGVSSRRSTFFPLIPKGSTFIGAGAEAFALKTPRSTVIRIGQNNITDRPKDSLALQPIFARQFGDTSFEELPFAPTITSLRGRDRSLTAAEVFKKRLKARGLKNIDTHSGNIGAIRFIPEEGQRPVTRILAIDPNTFRIPENTRTSRPLNPKNTIGILERRTQADKRDTENDSDSIFSGLTGLSDLSPLFLSGFANGGNVADRLANFANTQRILDVKRRAKGVDPKQFVQSEINRTANFLKSETGIPFGKLVSGAKLIPKSDRTRIIGGKEVKRAGAFRQKTRQLFVNPEITTPSKAITHELGHALDFALGNGSYLSEAGNNPLSIAAGLFKRDRAIELKGQPKEIILNRLTSKELFATAFEKSFTGSAASDVNESIRQGAVPFARRTLQSNPQLIEKVKDKSFPKSSGLNKGGFAGGIAQQFQRGGSVDYDKFIQPELNDAQYSSVRKHIIDSTDFNHFIRSSSRVGDVDKLVAENPQFKDRFRNFNVLFGKNKLATGKLQQTLFRGIPLSALKIIFGEDFVPTEANLQGKRFTDPAPQSFSKSLDIAEDFATSYKQKGIVIGVNRASPGTGALDLSAISSRIKRPGEGGATFDEEEVLFGFNQPISIRGYGIKSFRDGKPGSIITHSKGGVPVYESVLGFNKGGSAEDTVPAMLTPGEFVINRESAQKLGRSTLDRLNKTGEVKGFNAGGIVGLQGGGETPKTSAFPGLKNFDSGVFALGQKAEASAKALKDLTKASDKDTKTKQKNKDKAGTLSNAGGLTGVGSLFIASLLPSLLGQAEGRGGAGLTGAVSGGTTGAAIGAQFIPLLTPLLGPFAALAPVVGGLVGGFVGLTSSIGEFDKKIREEKFAESIEGLNTSVEGFITSGVFNPEALQKFQDSVADINNELSSIEKDFSGVNIGDSLSIVSIGLKQFAQTLLSTLPNISSVFENIGLGGFSLESIVPESIKTKLAIQKEGLARKEQIKASNATLPAFIKMKAKILENVSSFEAFENAQDGAGKTIVDALVKQRALTDTTITEEVARQRVIKELQAEIDTRNKATEAARKLAIFGERLDQSVQSISLFSESLSALSALTADSRAGLETTTQGLQGNIVTPAGPSIAARVAIAPTSLIGQEEFKRGLESVTSVLGEAGTPIKEFVLTQRQGVRELRGALKNAINKGFNAENIEAELRKQLGKAGIGDTIIDGLLSQLEAIGGSEGIPKAVEELRKDFPKIFSQLEQAVIRDTAPFIEAIGRTLDDQFKFIGESLKAGQQRLEQIADERVKVAELELQAHQKAAEFASKRLSLPSSRFLSVEQQNRPLQARLERLSGLQGAQAQNPAAVFAQLQGLQQRLVEDQDALEKLGPRTSGKDGNEVGFDKLRENITGFSSSINNTQNALRLLADASTTTAAAQQRLGELQQEEAGRFDLFTQIAGASPEELQRLNRQAGAALQAIAVLNQGGAIDQLPHELRQAAVAALSGPLSNIRLPSANGRTGREVLEQFSKRGIFGIQTALPKKEQEEVKTLENDIIKGFTTATEAQKLLTKSLTEQNKIVHNQFTKSVDKFDAGVDKLNTALQLTTKRTELENLQTEVAPLENIKEFKIGIDTEEQAKIFGAQAGKFATLARLQPELDKANLAAGKFNKEDVAKLLATQGLDQIDTQNFQLNNRINGEETATALGIDPNLASDILGTLNAKLQSGLLEKDRIKELRATSRLGNPFKPARPGRPAESDIDLISRLFAAEVEKEQETRQKKLQDRTKTLREGITETTGATSDQIDNIINNPKIIEALTPLSSLPDNISKLEARIKELQAAILKLEPKEPPKEDSTTSVPTANNAAGGPVFAQRGQFFKPRGTDTVPAMLTPGEFVVNREATKNNFGLLQSINDNKKPVFAEGGGLIDRTGKALNLAKTRDDIIQILSERGNTLDVNDKAQLQQDLQIIREVILKEENREQQRQSSRGVLGFARDVALAPFSRSFGDEGPSTHSLLSPFTRNQLGENLKLVTTEPILETPLEAKVPTRLEELGGERSKLQQEMRRRQSIKRPIVDRPELQPLPLIPQIENFKVDPQSFVQISRQRFVERRQRLGLPIPKTLTEIKEERRQKASERQIKQIQTTTPRTNTAAQQSDPNIPMDDFIVDPTPPYGRNYPPIPIDSNVQVSGNKDSGFTLKLGSLIQHLPPGQRIRRRKNRPSNNFLVNVPSAGNAIRSADAGIANTFRNFDRGVQNAFNSFDGGAQNSFDSFDGGVGGRRRRRRGINFFAEGGSVPSTDTVPAMLTPGEFVLNKVAASRIGHQKLQRFNRGGPVQYLQGGGDAQGGGTLGAVATLDQASITQFTQAFQQSFNNGIDSLSRGLQTTFDGFVNSINQSDFSSSISQLNNTLNNLTSLVQNIPQSISIEGSQRVEVIINGADILRNIQSDISGQILEEVSRAIDELRREQNPGQRAGPAQ